MSAETLARQRAVKLEEIKVIAATKGWTVLTQVYGGSKTKVDLMCDKGHVLSIISQHIERNQCSFCNGLNPKAAAEKFYTIVTEKGGFVPVDSYRGSNEHVEVICKLGHKWVTTPHVINQGSWCSVCADLSPVAAANKYYEILKSHNATALDPYVNAKTKIRVQCEKGHIWPTNPSTINSDKHWCPVCADRSPAAAAESYYEAVKERGGIPIDKYINRETKLKIQCGKGHTFMGRPDHIKSGRWCRTCNESKGELLVSNILKEFGLPIQPQASLPELSRCTTRVL